MCGCAGSYMHDWTERKHKTAGLPVSISSGKPPPWNECTFCDITGDYSKKKKSSNQELYPWLRDRPQIFPLKFIVHTGDCQKYIYIWRHNSLNQLSTLNLCYPTFISFMTNPLKLEYLPTHIIGWQPCRIYLQNCVAKALSLISIRNGPK
jgi:hypothetical protein